MERTSFFEGQLCVYVCLRARVLSMNSQTWQHWSIVIECRCNVCITPAILSVRQTVFHVSYLVANCILSEQCLFTHSVSHHVNMKVIVAMAIERLLHRPNIGQKAQ